MLYLDLKLVHILSSTVLFGTGLGTACNLYFANKTRDIYLIAKTARYVVIVDWIFTGTSGVIQPLTGFWMVYLNGYSFMTFWVLGSIIGYLIAAFCWFPVVYLQIKMRDLAETAYQKRTQLPQLYHRYFRYWVWLGWPAFISLLAVFYLMTNKPV
jgi:uncharacterized membrane protein